MDGISIGPMGEGQYFTAGIQPNRYWKKDEQPPSTGGTWGSITGTLSDQADLQAALDDKSNVGHTHLQSDITNLTTDLAAKVAKAGDTMTGALNVNGSSDTIQLRVRGNATQTTKPFSVQTSGGTEVFGVTNTGAARVTNGGYAELAPGASPVLNLFGQAGVGYYPAINFYSAGTNVGSIQGYGGILFAPASGYSVGSWAYTAGTTPFYVKSGYTGVHSVPMFEVRGYQGANNPWKIFQDGAVKSYGATASLNYPIAKRTGVSASASGTGGTLATNTYYYVVSACNFVGETIASSEVSVSITLGQNAVISWSYTNMDGVDHYRVYRTTSAGSYAASSRVDTGLYTTGTGVPYYIVSFTDTGYTASSGQPKTSVTHDIMTYRKWEGGTGAFIDFEDYAGTTLAQVKSDGSIQPASIADGSASNNSIYYSTTQNKLVYKDSGGVVNNLY